MPYIFHSIPSRTKTYRNFTSSYLARFLRNWNGALADFSTAHLKCPSPSSEFSFVWVFHKVISLILFLFIVAFDLSTGHYVWKMCDAVRWNINLHVMPFCFMRTHSNFWQIFTYRINNFCKCLQRRARFVILLKYYHIGRREDFYQFGLIIPCLFCIGVVSLFEL